MILWFWDVKHFKIVIFIYLKILLANKTECMLDHSLFFHNSMSTKTWHWYLTHLHLSPALLSSPAFLQLLQSELPSKPWYTHVLTSPSFRNTPNSISSKCCFPHNLKILSFQQQTPPPGDSNKTLSFLLLFAQTISSPSLRNMQQ